MHYLRQVPLWLGLIVAAPYPVSAQVPGDSTPTSLGRLVAELSPSERVRLMSGGKRWTGLVAGRSPDSLTVAGRSGTRSVPLSAIDTLWVRRESQAALAAGAGFGAVMFGLLQLGNGGDRYTATRLGGIIFLGAAGAGLLIDRAAERWSRRYPE